MKERCCMQTAGAHSHSSGSSAPWPCIQQRGWLDAKDAKDGSMLRMAGCQVQRSGPAGEVAARERNECLPDWEAPAGQGETEASRREGAPGAQGETEDGRRAEGETTVMQGEPEASRREGEGSTGER